MKKDKYKYKIKVWLATSGVALFSGLLAFGSYVSNNYIQSKAVSYNDNEYSIVFSDNEINDYTFENTFNYILDCQDNSLITNANDIYFTIHYRDHLASENDIEYIIDDINSEDQYFVYQNGYIEYAEYVILDSTINYKLRFIDSSDNAITWNNIVDYIEHEEGEQSYPSLSINTKQSLYTGLKNAIDLDIQANSNDTSLLDILNEFVGLLVGGIVELGQGLSTGIVSMAKSLFLEVDVTTGVVTGLSLFGGIIGIFAGIALAVGITTKVYTWVTSLGN